MAAIRLVSSCCIKCNAGIDISIDNFTFYQAERGNHYLYCEKCDSPYTPLPNPYEEMDRERDKAELARLSNPWRTLGILTFGGLAGYFLVHIML
ncbi:hypothetical protein A9267_17195 [Shewanella sp. UCD-FRSSP16_17]|uniref:hypothetical protein n=1 Tax=Shewanella sp. UCD-FRSSP16_17 TaxID=1853256 RepID=UPI0007EEAF6C|nr:hypothetical protein [Shewanella sp. UCD-FRSSP16_17]OBT04685.1 hypothetical protein A9267_17195 [Shewanella sp. UCD-FRSSP16_17]